MLRNVESSDPHPDVVYWLSLEAEELARYLLISLHHFKAGFEYAVLS